MDATCKVQDNIHVFRLVHNMCPEFWVHINFGAFLSANYKIKFQYLTLMKCIKTNRPAILTLTP